MTHGKQEPGEREQKGKQYNKKLMSPKDKLHYLFSFSRIIITDKLEIRKTYIFVIHLCAK